MNRIRTDPQVPTAILRPFNDLLHVSNEIDLTVQSLLSSRFSSSPKNRLLYLRLLINRDWRKSVASSRQLRPCSFCSYFPFPPNVSMSERVQDTLELSGSPTCLLTGWIINSGTRFLFTRPRARSYAHVINYGSV